MPLEEQAKIFAALDEHTSHCIEGANAATHIVHPAASQAKSGLLLMSGSYAQSEENLSPEINFLLTTWKQVF